MAKLTRYVSFEELKFEDESGKAALTDQSPRQSEFKKFLVQLRKDFTQQNKIKGADEK